MEELLKHLNDNQYFPDEIPLGKMHRFSRGNQGDSAWLLAFENKNKKEQSFFVLLYGDWRTGESHKFHSGKATKKEFSDAIKKATQERERLTQEIRERTSQKAQEIWGLASDNVESEYLKRKGLNSLYGAKTVMRSQGRVVLVPVKDIEGKLWGLQSINPDGEKRFMPGQLKQGCFHVIGEIENHDSIYVAEGFATACSIYEAVQKPTVVSFDAGNLESVSKSLKSKYQNHKFIICGDEDIFTIINKQPVNQGRIKATQAADLIGGIAVFPSFKENNEFKKLTDFNDLHLSEGIEAVRAHFPSDKIQVIENKFFINRDHVINDPYPDQDDKGNKRGTGLNLQELCKRLGVVIRYNVISKEEEIIIPDTNFSIDNYANASLAWLIDWCERVKIPYSNMKLYITRMAEGNRYNPVAEWVDSKPWDGTSRLKDLFNTIKSVNENDPDVLYLKETLIKKWLISAIAAAYSPTERGVSAHGVLVLQGAQYMGKTKWFKDLVPQEMKLTADGMTLKPDDKDSVYQVIRKWLVELGELDSTFRKSDIAQLKAFLTKDEDILRRPFAPRESNFGRRTVFMASVNEPQFLNDPTGNRRFWTIECESIRHSHDIDMQQLWAEVRSLHLGGEKWYLNEDEMRQLNKHNENFQVVDPLKEMILVRYDWEKPVHFRLMTATQVCIDIGINNPKKSDTQSIGRILRELTKEKPTESRGRTRFKVPNQAN